MKHTFLEVNTASLSIQKKRKKKFEFIWAAQNPMNKKNVCQLIIRNTNRFEYYITQQLLNDVNVSRCHTETLSYENMFIPLKYTLLLFSRFYFLGYKYEGHDFLRAGAFAPPELASATRLSYLLTIEPVFSGKNLDNLYQYGLVLLMSFQIVYLSC